MFLSILTKTERIALYISAFFILVMMVLTSIDTFLRGVFDRPLSGVYELSSMMMVGVLYLGLSIVQSKRNHIRMDLLSSKLTPDNQTILQLLSDIIFLGLALIITWQMGLKSLDAWTSGDFYYGVVRFPLWPAKLTITLGSALVGIRLMSDIVLNPLWYSQPGLNARVRYSRMSIAILVLVIFISVLLFTVNQDMSASTAGYIAILIFLFLLFIGVPVATSMALIGICGFWLMSGSKSALGTAASVPFSAASEYTMTVLPLFMALGMLADLAGFAEKGFNLAKKWTDQIGGGIVHATVVGSAIFAAATGSGAASCAVLTKITMPEMQKNGVKKTMAIGVVASASTLAVMIPPSTPFVIYAMLTGNSIGKLLIAGIIPGVICAAIIMLTVYIRCKLDPSLVVTDSVRHSTWKERFSALPGAWGVALIVIVIIGGIFSGFFTPTEAGAVGAFVVLVAALALAKGKRRRIFPVLADSAELASTILFIVIGGTLFGNMISVTRLPVMLSEWVVGLNISPIFILLCIIFIYIILGCFLDALSILIVTIPIVYPIILKLGYNPIWFGVLMVQNMEIAAITPPYGMNLFILKGLMPGTSMGEIFRSVLWFILPLVISMGIFIAFPQIVLWLPNLMSG